MAIALGLALLLNRSRRGVGLYRVAVYVPTVVPSVAYALIWLWIFNPRYGPLNLAAGEPRPAGAGLAGRQRHRPAGDRVHRPCSRSARASSCCWPGCGRSPRSAITPRRSTAPAAGATFRHITLPLLAPWLLLLTVRDIIVSAQNTFTPALLMTGGGPYYATLFVPLLMYETAFDRFRFGEGAAMTLIVFARRRRC